MGLAEQVQDGSVSVTPNGIPVYFQSLPKRLYRIGRDGPQWPLDEPELLLASAQTPSMEAEYWQDVPSVTEVLDVLHKPGLPWWGMETGVEGLMALNNLGVLREIIHLDRPHLAIAQEVIRERGEGLPASVEQVVELLTTHQLTVNHVRDRAGDRGLAVHDALEGWATSGLLPDPGIYSPTEAGYVKGLRQFLIDADPLPLASEVIVASREHGYAGRYDLRLGISKPRDIVARCYPKKEPQIKRLPVGEILADLKSSKGVYDSHPRQLEAYEEASLESGYEPTMARGILHVLDTGQYEFVRSWANFSDFLAVLYVWQSNQRMKARKPKGVG